MVADAPAVHYVHIRHSNISDKPVVHSVKYDDCTSSAAPTYNNTRRLTKFFYRNKCMYICVPNNNYTVMEFYMIFFFHFRIF